VAMAITVNTTAATLYSTGWIVVLRLISCGPVHDFYQASCTKVAVFVRYDDSLTSKN
jgi:hypothetical protein